MDEPGSELRTRFAHRVDDLQVPPELADTVRAGARIRRRRRWVVRGVAVVVLAGAATGLVPRVLTHGDRAPVAALPATAQPADTLPDSTLPDTTLPVGAAPSGTAEGDAPFAWSSYTPPVGTTYDDQGLVKPYRLILLPADMTAVGPAQPAISIGALRTGRIDAHCQYFRSNALDHKGRTAAFCVHTGMLKDNVLGTRVQATVARNQFVQRGTVNGRAAFAIVTKGTGTDVESAKWTALYFQSVPRLPGSGLSTDIIAIMGEGLTRSDFSAFIDGLQVE